MKKKSINLISAVVALVLLISCVLIPQEGITVAAVTPEGAGYSYVSELGTELAVGNNIYDHDFLNATAVPTEWKDVNSGTTSLSSVTVNGEKKQGLRVYNQWETKAARIEIPADNYVVKVTAYINVSYAGGIGCISLVKQGKLSDSDEYLSMGEMQIGAPKRSNEGGPTANQGLILSYNADGKENWNAAKRINDFGFGSDGQSSVTVYIYSYNGVNYYVDETGKLMHSVADAKQADTKFFYLKPNWIDCYLTDFEVYALEQEDTSVGVTLWSGEEQIGSISSSDIVAGALPELPIPEAPEGKYFLGYSTEKDSVKLLESNTLPAGVGALYAVFKDYVISATDTYKNDTTAKYAYNGSNGYQAKVNRTGWSAQFGSGYYDFRAYSTWGVAGAMLMSDADSNLVVLKPFTKYTITAKYTVPEFVDGLEAKVNLGWGMACSYDSSGMNKLENKGFVNSGEKIVVTGKSEQEAEITYTFTTDALTGILPVAGIFVSAPAVTDSKRSTVRVSSVEIEMLPVKIFSCDVHWNGGFADFDMTSNPASVAVEGEEVKLPAKAYRYQYAFAGWYTDENCTSPAGEYYVEGESYYAGWVRWGDANDDTYVDVLDLVAVKNNSESSAEVSVGSDVTDDGKINSDDLLRLRKKLLGYDVILGTTRYIAITFDDAPYYNSSEAGLMEEVVDIFGSHGGRATFFIVGSFVNDNNKSALNYAIDNGFELGNHSYSHGNLSAQTDKDKIKEQFTKNNERVRDVTGGYEMKIGRLPNLASSDLVYEVLAEINMPVMGSGINVGSANDKTGWHNGDYSSAVDGAIVLFHINQNDVAIMDAALTQLRADGYEFVTVSELFEIKGYDSIPMGIQNKRAEKQKKLLALTFDDGPNENMISIVDNIKEYGGEATFFLIGNSINTSAKPYLSYAYDNGFELGNHSGTHTNLTSANFSTSEALLADINITNDNLESVLGEGVITRVLRLPGLTGDDFTYSTLADAGIPVIDASMSAYDWAGSTSTVKDVANTIIKGAKNGGIICLHATAKTAEALLIALPQLEREYEFVTVSDMFSRMGYAQIPLGIANKAAEKQ